VTESHAESDMPPLLLNDAVARLPGWDCVRGT